MIEYKDKHNRRGILAPNPELWQALAEGHLLVDILRDFYNLVYADPMLNHFFRGVTVERAIEKQFSFLRSIFTGEKCYFGDHPKKAHSWMVISHELFDYREQLLESCMIKHGLPEHLRQKWRAVHEVFRTAIVKDAPMDTIINGIRKPAEGYLLETITVDTLCDNCEGEILANQEIISHIRTGEVYCKRCKSEKDLKLYKKTDDTGYIAVNG